MLPTAEALKAARSGSRARAHLGVIRAPVEDEVDFRWNEFIVLRDTPILIILGRFRLLRRDLALEVPVDTEHHLVARRRIAWRDRRSSPTELDVRSVLLDDVGFGAFHWEEKVDTSEET